MNERIRRQLDFMNAREHRKLRRVLSEAEWTSLCEALQDPALPLIERATRRLERFLEMETPVLLADTDIQFLRTLTDFPDIYAPGDLDEIRAHHFVHEHGKVCNLACDYETVLREGLEGRRARLLNGLDEATPEQKEYAGYVQRTIDAAERFADRYAALEEEHGQAAQAEALVFLGKVGFSVSQEHLNEGSFGQYDGEFLVLDEADRFAGDVIDLPASLCACVRFRGHHAESPAQYRRLMQFIREEGYTAAGFSREITVIDYGFTTDTEKFVTEIMIPLQKV